MIKYAQNLKFKSIIIFEGYMTIFNYYHLIYKKLTRYHFATVILTANEYTAGTESRSGTL
jgi:hypothetical protein